MAEIGNSIFSGRICDAAYTNPEHDTVEVLYRQVHPDEPSGTDAEIKNRAAKIYRGIGRVVRTGSRDILVNVAFQRFNDTQPSLAQVHHPL